MDYENALAQEEAYMREHQAELAQMGNAYNTSNPAAGPGDFIQHVGAQLILAKQLQPTDAAVQAAAAAAASANGGSQRPPFQPAAAAPGSSPTRPTSSGNTVADFISEVIDEDEFGG